MLQRRHEALMEAQKYPADYDGIVAAHRELIYPHLSRILVERVGAQRDAPEPNSAEQARRHPECGAGPMRSLDGVKDGIINDPASCRFDPAVLLCKNADGPECLTKPQLAALRKSTAVRLMPRRGRKSTPGFRRVMRPSRTTGTCGSSARSPIKPNSRIKFSGSFLFNDPHWDFRTFDLARDSMRADQEIGPMLNSSNPDLSAFAARGGKLILFHRLGRCRHHTAWDHSILSRDSAKNGNKEAQQFVRLFMAPGMMHCSADPDPIISMRWRLSIMAAKERSAREPACRKVR